MLKKMSGFECEGEPFKVPRLAISEWGPRLWGAAEIYAQLYPVSPSAADKEFAHNFYKASGVLHTLVPCPACKVHYNEYASTTPPDTSGQEPLIRWVLEAHNRVNRQNGKPEWSFEKLMCSYRGAGHLSKPRAHAPRRDTGGRGPYRRGRAAAISVAVVASLAILGYLGLLYSKREIVPRKGQDVSP